MSDKPHIGKSSGKWFVADRSGLVAARGDFESVCKVSRWIADGAAPRRDSVVKHGSSERAASPVLVPNGKRPRFVSVAERVAKVKRAEADAAAAQPLRLGGPAAGGETYYRPTRPRSELVLPPECFGDPTPEDRARRATADKRAAEAAARKPARSS